MSGETLFWAWTAGLLALVTVCYAAAFTLLLFRPESAR